MAITARTLVGAELQAAQFLGLPYLIRNNTTLNQKFEIEAAQVPGAGVYPKTQYLAIGNRGHRFVAGADGEPYPEYIKHRVSDQSLYRHIPFVCREEDDDLPPEQRSKYALRRVEIHNNKRYFVYYLMRLDYTNVSTELINTEVDEGVSNTVAFVHTNDNLNPTPPVVPPNQAVQTLPDGDYLSVRCLVTVQFTPAEVAEIINAVEITLGNRQLAAISELGIVSGVNKVVGVEEFGGGTVQFNEVIAAQITTHITTYNFLPASNDGARFTFDLGITESLLTEVNQGNQIAQF